ncbi:hypothetical protein ACFV5N_26900, partial [Streptomyces sp. NPDC059853]
MRLTRTRTAVAAGALAGLTALALSSAGTATAAGQAPAFLEPGDLPPHRSSDWFAQEIRQGAPELPPFCLEDVELPADGTWSREYHTDLDT